MDKKLIAARHRQGLSKPKSNQPAGGLIALGSSNRPETPESHSSGAGKPSTAAAVKRDLTGLGGNVSSLPPKKARLAGDYASGSTRTGQSSVLGSTSAGPAVSRKDPTNDSLWLHLATSDVAPSELLAKIKSAEDKLKTSRIPKYICSTLKLISEKKHKPIDPAITVALSYLANHNPAYFQETAVIEAFCSLLKRQSSLAGKVGKQENLHAPFVCNLLLKAFCAAETWPLTFVKVFLDDSLTDRAWVDKSECQVFVKNVQTAFGTVSASPEFLVSLNFGELAPPTVTTTPGTPPVGLDEKSRDSSVEILIEQMEEGEKEMTGNMVKNRFDSNAEEVREYTIQLLQDWWSRRLDITPKNLLRTMSATCGLTEVRQAAAQKLDTWLQNTKLQKPALELLMTLCINCPAPKSQTDLDILSALTRIRGMKNKPVLHVYCAALKEMFAKETENIGAVIKLVLHNELSPSARAPNNMMVLHQCFLFDSDKASEVLGSIFSEFLLHREDFSKPLRAILRELARSVLRNEFPMLKLGRALLHSAAKSHQTQIYDILQERTFMALVDLVCLTVLLGVTPTVKEAAQARKDLNLVRKYQRDVGEMLRMGIFQNITSSICFNFRIDYCIICKITRE